MLQLAETAQVTLDASLSTDVPHPLTGNGATVRQFLGMRSGLWDLDATQTRALAQAFLHDDAPAR